MKPAIALIAIDANLDRATYPRDERNFAALQAAFVEMQARADRFVSALQEIEGIDVSVDKRFAITITVVDRPGVKP